MRPNQPAEKIEILADMERSARVEVKLRHLALANAKSHARHLLTPEQFRELAGLLRRRNPNRRAAQLAELAAKAREAKRG